MQMLDWALTSFCGAAAAVLPFAKRGDDRSNNLVRLQQLFPRIVAADYEQPKRVSEDCRHLLKRMLTPDPNKRVTIPEIMQHPWYAFPLLFSRGAAVMAEVLKC